jgi:AraC-like DNA-binding protein
VESDPGGVIGTKWACDVANVCQAVVGDILEGEPAAMGALTRRLRRDLPRPSSAGEAVWVRVMLAGFLSREAGSLHDRYHAKFAPAQCRIRPPAEESVLWLDQRYTIDTLLDGCAQRFRNWFTAHHQLPPALRAVQLLRDNYQDALVARRLQLEVGCSRTTLIQQFRAQFGVTPAQYLARLRIREGIRLLRESRAPVEEVAAQVGYRSANKFHRRVLRETKLAPSQLRNMEAAAVHRVMQERVPLESAARKAQRSPETAKCQPASGTAHGDG